MTAPQASPEAPHVAVAFSEDDPAERTAYQEPVQLMLDLDGFEGPIDVLLSLARQQKVDLRAISILKLADQYITYVQQARQTRLELAADYLVMASWLAYLKSRLLLPEEEGDDEPTGQELADALALQLRRLEAMQEAGKRLMAQPRLGLDVFARSRAEGPTHIEKPLYAITLHDLISAYAGQQRRTQKKDFKLPELPVFSIEDAVQRLSAMIGRALNWMSLLSFLPPGFTNGLAARSALASTLVATLELARQGKLDLRQSGTFGPIFVRHRKKESE